MLQLLGLLGRKTGTLNDGELKLVAQVLGGDGADVFFEFLKLLRERESESRVSQILSTPTAEQVFLTALGRL